MTDMKKTAKDKAPARRKKLQLNKETLRDISAAEKAQDVRGGAGAAQAAARTRTIEPMNLC